MKHLVLIFGLLFTCLLNSQNLFQKGEITLNSGVKLEGLILDENWYEVPAEITFKNNETSTEREIKSNAIKKLEIYDKYLFERHEVDIEFYTKKLALLTKNRKSEFEKQSLLLKVLIKGETSLLKYSQANVNYFFYKKNDSIFPLEYKLYRTTNNKLGENLNYKKTLNDIFKCSNNNILKTDIAYNEKSLVDFFKNYHDCNAYNYQSYVNTTERNGDFNLRAKAGVGFSKIVPPTNGLGQSDETIFKFGVEFEYIFPFSNKSWSMFFESNYHSFEGQNSFFMGYGTVPSSGLTVKVYRSSDIEFTSIENHLGVRKYIPMDKKQSLFVNTGLLFDIVLKSVVDNNDTNSNSTLGFFFGAGYDFNKKVNVELRYNFTRDLTEIDLFNTDYTNFSIKLGYNFL